MRFSWLLVFFVFLSSACVGAESGAQEISADSVVFATVDGVDIPAEDYMRRMRVEYRNKFYHGKPPAAEVAALRLEVSNKVIDELLLVKKAKEEGLEVDAEYVEAAYKSRTKGIAQEELDAAPDFSVELRERIVIDQLLEMLEREVRAGVVAPTQVQLVAFYEANPGMFTTPAKNHIRMILLGVPAYVEGDAWEAAQEKASELVSELREGAGFSELAMIHSSDPSATAGGDMGYLHDGMLGGAGDQVIKLMEIGDISEPVFLLEGVAIFELLDRSVAKLNALAVVEERAMGLLVRETKESSWENLKRDLREAASVIIHDAFVVN